MERAGSRALKTAVKKICFVEVCRRKSLVCRKIEEPDSTGLCGK